MFIKNKLFRVIGIVVLCFIGNISIGHAQSSASKATTSKNQTYQPIDISKLKMERGEATTAQKNTTTSKTQKYQPIDVSKLKAENGETIGQSNTNQKQYQPIDVSKLKAEEAARQKKEKKAETLFPKN